RTVPGFADVIGTATSNTTVTVNDQPTTRQSDYFHAAVPTTNTTTAAYPVLHVLGVQNYAGPDDEDAIAEHTGRAFVPQTPEAFVFDEEGNLTQDGRWIYSWDAFNRLIRQETRADLPAEVPRRRLEFAYDHQGRRTRKLVSAWQQDQWTPTADLRYVYDGWTLLAELDALATPEAPTLLRSYLWGPDLSSTMRGAGGAGGLVAVTLHQPTPKTHYAIADAGGNVTALVAADTGELSAVYEYAPYGALLRATGPAASLNPIRHASKLADLETGLAYYGHRYYSPDLGRWLSRDPLAENGGVNLYAFLGNDPVNYTDPLGLAGFFFDGTYNYTDAAGVSAANQQRPTNVWKMWRAYDEASKWYYGGIGNEVEFGSGLTHWLGGAGGRGGQGILDRAFERVTQTYNRWDKKIDIFGFSRGAALALEFSNMIADGIVVTDENGEEVKITTRSGSRFTMKWCDVRIRFVGLYDVVGSFGLPGNHINPGYRLYLPTKIPVTKAVHAIALDEYRSFFPVTNIRGALQVGFRGAHSDIGGSYAEEGLSNITLRWMIQHARSVGVRFRSTYDQAPVNHFQPPHNSAGEGSPTGLRGFPPDMIIHDSAFGSSLLTGWIQ
ncbi:DUF2235 domain-containing protein, partial [bacterium]|nr:DUF2235 domain-containing protein [bacterium]